jgi:hypothetical protein
MTPGRLLDYGWELLFLAWLLVRDEANGITENYIPRDREHNATFRITLARNATYADSPGVGNLLYRNCRRRSRPAGHRGRRRH